MAQRSNRQVNEQVVVLESPKSAIALVVQVQGLTRQHTLYYWVVPKTVPANLQ